MKKTVVALLLVCAAGLMLQMAVPDAEAFQKEHCELILGGNGSSDESFDNTIFSAAGSLGYFLTDNFEALVRQDIKYSEITGGGDLWNGGTRFGIDYHLNVGAFYPFVGASIGYLYGDSVEEQFIAGPQLGVKYFVNSTTFIMGMMEYEFLFDETNKADDNFDEGRYVYNIGIGFIW